MRMLSLILSVILFHAINGEHEGVFVSEETVAMARERLEADMTELRAGHAVRLAFHDCVGGCDGCLNRAHPANFALPNEESWLLTVDLIDAIYDSEFADSGLSRADFYILAGEAGLANSVKEANKSTNDKVPKVRLTYFIIFMY